jgi:hypothetical protein
VRFAPLPPTAFLPDAPLVWSGAYLFGKSVLAAISKAWMIPFARIFGYRLRPSEIAATAIAIAAVVVGSMQKFKSEGSLAVLEKKTSARNSFYRYISLSHCWVWTIASRMANT